MPCYVLVILVKVYYSIRVHAAQVQNERHKQRQSQEMAQLNGLRLHHCAQPRYDNRTDTHVNMQESRACHVLGTLLCVLLDAAVVVSVSKGCLCQSLKA